MAKHRIFVLWNHPLFYESVRLLLQKDEIEWTGATSRVEEAFSDIERLQPDTILIEEEEGGDIPDKAIKLLENSSASARLFRLSLNDNDLEIYYREQKTVVQPEDLLHLIRNVDG
jgi:DNA-binding NarL/FixJ family response regulator